MPLSKKKKQNESNNTRRELILPPGNNESSNGIRRRVSIGQKESGVTFTVSLGSTFKKFYVPKEMPQVEDPLLGKVLELLYNFAIRHPKIDLTSDARLRYQEWCQRVYGKCLDNLAIDFMILFAVRDGKHTFDEDIVEEAIAICDWDYQVSEQYSTFVIDTDGTLAKMEDNIRRCLRREAMKFRTLSNMTNGRQDDLSTFYMALKNLKKAGEIKLNQATQKYELIDHE